MTGVMPDDSLQGEAVTLRSGVSLRVCHTPGRSPALVFLHGGLGNRFNWRSQYEFAQAQGWETLTYDLAGHGQSSPYSRYSIGRHCRDLNRILHHFHIHNPILCCHSYGVPLGLEWASRYPTRALILIAGGTHNLTPWWEVVVVKGLAWGGRHLFRLPWVQQLSASMVSHQSQQLQQFFTECPTPAELHPYEILEIFWGYNFFNRRQAVYPMNIPALIITGGQDSVFTEMMGRQLATHFKDHHHLHLSTAGHLAMAEFPDQVNSTIAHWISTLQVSASA